MQKRSLDLTSNAWYAEDRPTFLRTASHSVVSDILSAAASQGWYVEPEQHEEWAASVDILQRDLNPTVQNGLSLLHNVLRESGLTDITDVVLEYNFKRRGLRLDCVLLAPGLILVIEFKRSKISRADCDQVTNYCINLVEFHHETRELCEKEGFLVVPIVVLTEGSTGHPVKISDLCFDSPWASIVKEPIRCDSSTLRTTIESVLCFRKANLRAARSRWVSSHFAPSSTILDAAISLYGSHDVSAIDQHASSTERIADCVNEIVAQIHDARESAKNRIVLVSGAPGSGKTLVGLRIAFHPNFRDDTVFVTGNAPLVDVLSAALKRSYRRAKGSKACLPTGYLHDDARRFVVENSLFKIVKAHNFLGERDKPSRTSRERIVVFDEAQRTYRKGKNVRGKALTDHEADLILKTLEDSSGTGIVLVALVGQNQAIAPDERGPIAWLEAASRRGWGIAVSKETLALSEFAPFKESPASSEYIDMAVGHLSESLRFYRNKAVEEWSHEVLLNKPDRAAAIASQLLEAGHPLLLTRDLDAARRWVRSKRVGEERCGVIASGQARRLAAEGLFVDLKPSIADWMLNPANDVRSSSMLETVQNTYQIQGLELDYTIVCWDADLRREANGWRAYKMNGPGWNRDKALDVAMNGYRVLMTRARKGMIFFVPRGDTSLEDSTRSPQFYDTIAAYLRSCGARETS